MVTASLNEAGIVSTGMALILFSSVLVVVVSGIEVPQQWLKVAHG
jgi:hypothetical protein